MRDKENLKRSGIIVIRVRNKNIEDIHRALEQLKTIEQWSIRRIKIGLRPLKRHVKEGRVPDASLPIFSGANNAGHSYLTNVPN